MAKVIPVGPIDPVLYGFAKKQAEKAERDPRYVPKRLETPAHSITYRRVGAMVKAFVIDKIAPVLMSIAKENALPIMPRIPDGVVPASTVLEDPKTSKAVSSNFRNYHGKVTHVLQVTPPYNEARTIDARFVVVQKRNVVDGGYTFEYKSTAAPPYQMMLHIHDAAHDAEMGFPSLENPGDYGNESMEIIRYQLDVVLHSTIPSGSYVLNDLYDYHLSKYLGGSRYTDKDGVEIVHDERYYSNSFGMAATPIYIKESVEGVSFELLIKSNYIKSATLDVESSMAFATIDKDSFLAKTKNDVRPPVVFVGDASGYHYKINQEYHYDPREIGYFGRLDKEVMAGLWDGYEGMWHVPALDLPTNLNSSTSAINRYMNKKVGNGYVYDSSIPRIPSDEPTKSYADINAPDNKYASFVGITIDSLGDVYHVLFTFEIDIARSTWEHGRFIGETEAERITRIWHRFGGGAKYELYKNGVFLRVVKELSKDEIFGDLSYAALDWHQVNDTHSIAHFVRSLYTYKQSLLETIYGSMDKEGGCVVVFSRRYETHRVAQQFPMDGAFALTDDGLFALLTDEERKKIFTIFVPIEPSEDVVRVVDIESDSKIFRLEPHKKYKRDSDSRQLESRDQHACLFVKEAAEDGRARRCFMAFDDGMCVDLTDFAEQLRADPSTTAENWEGKPFRYVPVELYDSYHRRRIKRAYAPQWVRAYYDYEEQT